MKRLFTLSLIMCFVVGMLSSCKTGEGCPGENNWQKAMEVSDKPSKPKSGLFKKRKK